MLREAFVLRSTEVHPEFYGFVCGHTLGVPLILFVRFVGSYSGSVVCSQLLIAMLRSNPSAFIYLRRACRRHDTDPPI